MSALPAADAARAVTVVKLGGRALEGADAVEALAQDVATLEERVAIVHGGGAEASAWCARLGIAPRFHDGLRVTDPATLPVVVAVLAGLANKRLVAALRAQGVNAAGISALDGGLLEVAPHPLAGTLGAVGAVRGARPALLEALWSAGITPVIASIAAGAGGALLNVNADDVAAALAAALDARLVLLSDTPGLVLDGAPVASLAVSDIEPALARPDVTGGMRPKLRAAGEAIAAGARSVTLADWRGAGTLAHALAGARGTTLVPDPDPVESSS
ncbi:MAG TPA: acetylglutamate kinase [Candidatus Eisenbacteria bacterium]|nr:acetylglutamate kinase [Candidatus Eisenbacteria bacterium]